MTLKLRHDHIKTLAIAALLCAIATAAQAQSDTAPDQTPSARKAGEVVITQAELSGPNGEKLPYELGTIFVPENRRNPRSRLIGVAFAWFRAASEAASPLWMGLRCRRRGRRACRRKCCSFARRVM